MYLRQPDPTLNLFISAAYAHTHSSLWIGGLATKRGVSTIWNDATRAQSVRAYLVLRSNLTDTEWALFEPHFPPRSRVGASMHMTSAADCRGDLVSAEGRQQRRMPSSCFLHVSTVRRWLNSWQDRLLSSRLQSILAPIVAEGAVSRSLTRRRGDQLPERHDYEKRWNSRP